MAVKVPMPSTCAAAADRAPDFVPLRGAPFADKSCGPPAGRAKKSRVARRARAQEVPLDVATWPCRACDARSERACLEPAARIGLLLACSLALSVLLPALCIISPGGEEGTHHASRHPPTWSVLNRAAGHFRVSNSRPLALRDDLHLIALHVLCIW